MVFPGSPTPQRAAQELQRRHAGAQGVSWCFFVFFRRKIHGKNPWEKSMGKIHGKNHGKNRAIMVI